VGSSVCSVHRPVHNIPLVVVGHTKPSRLDSQFNKIVGAPTEGAAGAPWASQVFRGWGA
jgi:hypothetical protein